MVRVLIWSGSGEGPLLGFRLLYPQMAERGQESSLDPLYNATNLIHEGSIHDLMTPRGLPPNSVTLRGMISTHEFGEIQTFSPLHYRWGR